MLCHQVSVHGKGRGCFGVFPTGGQPLYLLWYTAIMPNVCSSPQNQLFIRSLSPKILLPVIYNTHRVPLINLPLIKLVSVLSRIILRFLKQAREHDGTGASLQIPACRCSWKSPTLCRRHVHRTSFTITICSLWDAPTSALSLQGTRALRGAAGVKLFPPLGSLQGT